MNRATGYAYAPGDTPTLIGCFVYNGTTNRITDARLAPTADDAWQHYRDHGHMACACSPAGSEPVLLCVDTGIGFSLEGTWCSKCAALTSPLDLTDTATAPWPAGIHVPASFPAAAPEVEDAPAPKRRAAKDGRTVEPAPSIDA